MEIEEAARWVEQRRPTASRVARAARSGGKRDRPRRRVHIETAIIQELEIEDVDPTETDDELWEWAMNTVFLPNGISVKPWTRYTLRRHPELGSATISLLIEIEADGTDNRRRGD
jgi:hypothetical protein